MSVSPILTFMQSAPHRPGTSDILNGTKTNSTPTVPPNMPAAEEYTQMAALLVAAGAMMPVARASITGGATPALTLFSCVRTDVGYGQVTVHRVSAGIVEVTLPSGYFPTPVAWPRASLNGANASRVIAAEVIPNGARVRTSDLSGTPQDTDFTLELF